jgi:hypothetical protein
LSSNDASVDLFWRCTVASSTYINASLTICYPTQAQLDAVRCTDDFDTGQPPLPDGVWRSGCTSRHRDVGYWVGPADHEPPQWRIISTGRNHYSPWLVARAVSRFACSLLVCTTSGYQYAAFWTPSAANASVRNVALSRRPLSGKWETLILNDYNQTEDDGHDM